MNAEKRPRRYLNYSLNFYLHARGLIPSLLIRVYIIFKEKKYTQNFHNLMKLFLICIPSWSNVKQHFNSLLTPSLFVSATNHHAQLMTILSTLKL